MSLILHHFQKEFRYLRLRWFGFLALLVLDLAVSLEWLFPLKAGFVAPSWLGWIPQVLLLAGLSLLISCPEDSPGSDRSFISTRPLSWKHYWLAKGMLWLVLLVVPAVLQSTLYLLFSGSSWQDVLRGTFERGFMVVALSAWLLPASALWRRGERWWVIISVAGIVFLFAWIMNAIVMKHPVAEWLWPLSWRDLATGWLLFSVLTALLAWWHLRAPLTLRRRFILTAVFGCLSLAGARHAPWGGAGAGPADPAWVRKNAPQVKVHLDLDGTNFGGFEREGGRHFSATSDIKTGQPGVHAALRQLGSKVTQEGKTFGSHVPVTYETLISAQTLDMHLHCADMVLRDFFPPGTLFVIGGERNFMWQIMSDDDVGLTTFEAPFPDPAKPLQIKSDYALDWFQREVAINLPLVEGSGGRCDSHSWRVTRVFRPAEGNHKPGDAALGSLSVSLHVESRNHWDARPATLVLLHSPQRRMVWLQPLEQVVTASRGGHTGVVRHTVDLQWQGIFNHADGESTGVDASQLRLILLRNQYLGSSDWSWQSPDIRLADYPSPYALRRLESAQALYAGREQKAFQERLATLTVPTADSPEPVVRRYLYDLLSTTSTTYVAYKPAAFDDITKAFAPLGEHHLPLLLDLQSGLWPGWSNRPPRTVLDKYLTSEHREAVIDRVMTNETLASVVMRKGWTEDAKRLRPKLLSMPSLPRGTDSLLLAWADEASIEKLFQQMPRSPHADMIREMGGMPAYEERVKAIIMQQYERSVPLLASDFHDASAWVSHACNLGSKEALDICLRWQALRAEPEGLQSAMPYPDLLNAEGKELWDRHMDAVTNAVRVRHLKADQFDYLPEKRAWKLRQP